MQQRHLNLIERPISALNPAARNPRTHSPQQIRQIADSIHRFGFTNPILIDADQGIIAGHGRVEAAKLLGMQDVPTLSIEHLTEAELRAYAIADNRLAENAGWDKELLSLEFNYIVELDIDFDLTVIGFETPEIDLILSGPGPAMEDPADELPTLDEERPTVSQAGDLWTLGTHRLLCADATDQASFARLLGDQQAQLVFIDPPYNVPIKGHVSGMGAIQHREFAMAAGEMSTGEFTMFLQSVFSNLAHHSLDGAIHFICMDWRHIVELMSAGNGVYSELKNLCVWNKNNGGMGSLYRSKHELVFVFKHGIGPHINNVELGRHGRYRTNVWDYPGANTLRPDRLEELAMHPTVKPVALVADAIRDCSERSGVVLDCFGGSGTTLIAAERTGRCGYLMELDPGYVDITVRRFEELTDQQAIHTETGLTFAERAEQRSTEEPINPSSVSQEVSHG